MTKRPKQTKQPILSLAELSKYYGRDIGIENVSLEVYPGEVFGFLGPNGAGKSTTIRTILGFIAPTSGEVKCFGETDPSAIIRAHDKIGYLAGDAATYESMTGRGFLRYMAALRTGVDWTYVDELAVRFEADLSRPIKHLSKGNRQKVALIQAFMHRPDLVILDEPTTGLDPLMKQTFYDLVRDTAERGASVFVSSHDLAEVQKICDRAAFIRGGKLIGIESIADVLHLSTHRYTLEFGERPSSASLKALQSVTECQTGEDSITCVVSGDVSEFLQAAAKLRPKGLREHELELEELFLHYYRDGGESS